MISEDEVRRIRDENLHQFFEENNSQSSSRPWQTKEWKEKRDEILDDKCAWCGAEKGERILILHHPDHHKLNYKKLWGDILLNLFPFDILDKETHFQTKEICPRCKYANIYERTTMKPKYRCQKCGAQFDEPIKRLRRRHYNLVRGEFLLNKLGWNKVLEWLNQGQNRDKIMEKFEDIYKRHWEKYFSLKNTVTICKKCHFLYEKKNMKICSVCGENYGKIRQLEPGKSDYFCWECFAKLKGLKKCPECGKGWYNPDKYDKCKKCRFKPFEK